MAAVECHACGERSDRVHERHRRPSRRARARSRAACPARAARRNASENRASVSTDAIATITQKLRGRRRGSAKRMRACFRRWMLAGSSTPKTIRSTHTTAGTTAIQNTAWKSPANRPCPRAQASGRSTAPTVSSAWRNAEAAAAQLGRCDVRDQRVARRTADALADAIGEARAPPPSRATARAGTRTWSPPRCRSPASTSGLRLRDQSDSAPEKSLHDQRQRLGDAPTTPMTSALAPSTVAMYSGSSACTSSDDMSIAQADAAQHPHAARNAGDAPLNGPITLPAASTVDAHDARSLVTRDELTTSPRLPCTTHSTFMRSSVTW